MKCLSHLCLILQKTKLHSNKFYLNHCKFYSVIWTIYLSCLHASKLQWCRATIFFFSPRNCNFKNWHQTKTKIRVQLHNKRLRLLVKTNFYHLINKQAPFIPIYHSIGNSGKFIYTGTQTSYLTNFLFDNEVLRSFICTLCWFELPLILKEIYHEKRKTVAFGKIRYTICNDWNKTY